MSEGYCLRKVIIAMYMYECSETSINAWISTGYGSIWSHGNWC